MKTTYRVLACAVVALVVVQAADLAYGFFGMGAWVEDGNDFTKSALESTGTGITGEAGLMLHSVIGQFLIPLVALALLAIAFVAQIEDGLRWAGLLFGAIVVQVFLAFVSFGVPVVGILHGINAFLILGFAVMAIGAATRSITLGSSAKGTPSAV